MRFESTTVPAAKRRDKAATELKAENDERLAGIGHSQHRLLGIFVRKERWSLSWRGWLLVALLLAATNYFFFTHIHPFLAVTHPVDTKILVVEGWVQRYGFRAAVDEFNNGAYERIYTTGGPENGSGGYTNDYQTMASAGAEVLKKLGIPEDALQMVPSHVSGRERTYSSAAALRDWFNDRKIAVRSLNILTEDCHARRTQLLYQEAFGKNVLIGVIAVPNPDYNPEDWWRYSDGVREVIGETIAYIYAKYFFHPSSSTRQPTIGAQSGKSR